MVETTTSFELQLYQHLHQSKTRSPVFIFVSEAGITGPIRSIDATNPSKLGHGFHQQILDFLSRSAFPRFPSHARCQSDSGEGAETTEEVSDVGIVGQNTQDLGDESYSSAPGIVTHCVFPKNGAKLVPAGEETDLLVGVKNDGNGIKFDTQFVYFALQFHGLLFNK